MSIYITWISEIFIVSHYQIEKIAKILFHKHFKNLQFINFNPEWGLHVIDQTWGRVFDLASQTNQYLKRNLRWELA